MYQTKITFTVLSKERIPNHWDLSAILFECEEGEFVKGYDVDHVSTPLTGKQMADALHAAGSDPGFFNLDNTGNPIDYGD